MSEKKDELEAARNLEPDCDYGAVGAGRYRSDMEAERDRLRRRLEDQAELIDVMLNELLPVKDGISRVGTVILIECLQTLKKRCKL